MAINFKINTQKAVESVLWLIQRGESNMYNIWKMLFAAEKYHLNKYGRPITGDRYIAMKYGTVPGWLYSQTKDYPRNIGVTRRENFLFAERAPTTMLFSESDEEALEHGYNEYTGLNFGEVMAKNHKEPAWIKNYDLRGNSESAPIPFEELIDVDWLKDDLELDSHFMVI